ncbi:MAG: DNA-deoxyinosine glycosylase [Gammaproteobacteria bacterium]|jgi:hypoxanthine-DNA glycosylase|nr:DNA-deoxyinosine glycosylase [Gammaproteobacteria bacterium]
MTRIYGFPPVIGDAPRALVLGSMPGIASLNANEYYAMSRNAFWPIMKTLFDAGFELPYEQRIARLQICGIALWDVLASCVRPGSLDASIKSNSVETNDISGLLSTEPTITHVCFNGRAAADLYRRHITPQLTRVPETILLPSTSPAHAAVSFTEKLEAWSALLTIAPK